MPSIITQPLLQFVKATGEPAVGWKIYTYEIGTSTPKPTYTDYNLTSQQTNPGILDARGMINMWLDGGYKIVLTDENDVVIGTQDNVYSTSSIDFSGIDVDIYDINSTNTECIPINTDYSCIFSDRGKTITANAAGNDIRVFLPPISSVPNKWMIRLKKVDLSLNTVTLVTNLNEEIDQMDDYVLHSYGDLIEVLCDGSSWRITTLYERNHSLSNSIGPLDIIQQYQNKVISCDSTTGNFIVNLPAVATVGNGFSVTIRRNSAVTSNMVSIIANGTEIIFWSYYIGATYSQINLKTINECITLMTVDNGWVVTNYANPVPGMIGDIKFTDNGNQPGWIHLDSDYVISSPAGIHGGYQGNIYKDLFKFLWDTQPDSVFHVVEGRGLSSEDDWNAGKSITLPQVAGRAIVGQGAGIGLTPRNIGTLWGSETFNFYNDSFNGSHNHGVGKWWADSQTPNNETTGGLYGNPNSGNLGNLYTMLYSGSGTPFSIIQPSTAAYAFIKI